MIETKRLYIRMIVEEDWQDLQRIWLDFASSPYACYDAENPLEETAVQNRVKTWAKKNRQMEKHRYYGVLREHTLIGFIGVGFEENYAEIGYAFCKRSQGKGYAKESIQALMEYLFKTEGVTCFAAGTALANTPSMRLLKSLGFVRIGEEKVSFYKDENGEDIWFDGGIFGKVMR